MHKLAEAYLSFHPTLHPERLDQPAARKKPAVIGVCFMGDLFDPALDEGDRFAVLNTLQLSPRHTFVLLTKQPETMHRFLIMPNPQPNWHLGFSARTQEEFDAGWPHMSKLAAAGWKVWVSLEPLLGPVDLNKWDWITEHGGCTYIRYSSGWLSGVIVGEQSGSKRPPFDTDWVRSIRDQCAAAGVPFMFKQARDGYGRMVSLPELDGHDGVFRVHKELAW
jgi:protein gp37